MLRRKLIVLLVALLCLTFAIQSPVQAATAAQKSKKLPYRLEVDIANQLVIAYSNQTGEVVRTMLCSTGRSAGATPRGTFYLPTKRYKTERGPWHAMMGGVYARYATRIRGSILFHSIIYSRKKVSTLNVKSWKNLGDKASAGCIRLTPLDAQWIAYNCATNTKVVIKNGKKTDERQAMRKSIRKKLPPAKKDGTLSGWEPTLSPTPTPRPATLINGSTGATVKTAQKRMKALGYYAGKIDGKYGSKMITAVKRLQKSMGLEETGLITPEFGDEIKSDKLPTGTYVTFKKGDKGPVITRIQTELKVLGLYSAKVNGTFDAKTVTAVKKFYAQAKLKKRSDATATMQKALSAAASEVIGAPTQAPSPSPAPAA